MELRTWPGLLCRRSLFFLLASTALAAPPQFEVAAVHPSASSNFTGPSAGFTRRGHYLLRHATLLDLLRFAFDTEPTQILGGPNWLDLDRFDISARVPPGTVGTAVRPMLQTLLAERFGLAAHRDNKPVPAWALTAGNRPLLKRSDGSGDSGCRSRQSEDLISLTCRNITMADFVSDVLRADGGVWYYLTGNLVVDRTGLTGGWDFDLKYSARWNTAVAGAKIVSLFDAIDKLGLKLDAAMVPMPVLIVDRVNRTPTPNSAGADQAFPPIPTAFEVAAVKPANPEYQGEQGFQLHAGGLVDIHSVTLRSLIANAWGISQETIANAPSFIDSERWDIVAKAPEDAILTNGDDDFDALSAMVKSLLADRFQLAAHFEDRTMPTLVMIASKPKLKRADPNSRSGCREGLTTLVKVDPRSTNPTAARLVTCTNVSMAYLASRLRFLASGYVHGEVLDATALDGGWDFTLSFSKVRQLQGTNASPPVAGEPSDPNGALSVQEAMEKQLGLKLVTRKRSMPVLVIDHIEKKPSGN